MIMKTITVYATAKKGKNIYNVCENCFGTRLQFSKLYAKC